MYADLDELVLSGRLFNGGNSRSSSPERSPSPDSKQPRWPGNEEKIYEEGADYSSDVERQQRISRIINATPSDAPEGSIGMGPGRTGVKGVIRDRAEAQARSREKKNAEIRELNARMEKASLRAQTYNEEEEERELERLMLEGAPSLLTEPQRARNAMGKSKPRFGHLREVGVKNFVSAVEREDRGVWVLVHLYDASLDRCFDLDTVLSRLARSHPNVKFLRARASALGFASTSSLPRLSSSSTFPRGIRSSVTRIEEEEDDDDPYLYDEKDITDLGEEEDSNTEGTVDTDVLPTLLAYCDGELQHTWVRVDWEAGKLGVEDLLERHHVLGSSGPGSGNCGLPPDDLDDDELWSSD